MAINIALLNKLTQTPGIAGREEQVRAIMVEELRALTDEVRVDRLGNVIACKRGKSDRRVMLAGHRDEIGFIVQPIDNQGFIRLQPLGGLDAGVLVAKPGRAPRLCRGERTGRAHASEQARPPAEQ